MVNFSRIKDAIEAKLKSVRPPAPPRRPLFTESPPRGASNSAAAREYRDRLATAEPLLASELIEELTALIQEHGDLPVTQNGQFITNGPQPLTGITKTDEGFQIFPEQHS